MRYNKLKELIDLAKNRGLEVEKMSVKDFREFYQEVKR